MRSGTTWLLAGTLGRNRSHLTERVDALQGATTCKRILAYGYRSIFRDQLPLAVHPCADGLVYAPCSVTVRQLMSRVAYGRALGHALVYGFMSAPPHYMAESVLGLESPMPGKPVRGRSRCQTVPTAHRQRHRAW